MHTFTWDCKIRIHYSGDFGGDIVIVTAAGEKEEKHTVVPFAALMGLVAEHVRREQIAALEEATPEMVLNRGTWIQRLLNREG